MRGDGLESLTGMAVFAAVVQANGFAAAGERLGLSRSAVSKHIARLEKQLGARLLQRTTRRISLTEAGSALYPRAAAIVGAAAEAEIEVGRLHEKPRGTLRLSAPMSFGQRHLGPLVADFLAAHDEIRIEMMLDDGFVDLLEGGFDCAIRIGQLADSSLAAKRLAPARRVVCAAPAYLDRRGRPQTLDDLRQHNCLNYIHSASRAGWPFAAGKKLRPLPVAGNLESNNGDVLRAAALAGLGLVLLPTFIVGDDLAGGALEAVLADHRTWDASIFAVWPSRRQTPPKVRAFVDFLAKACGPRPYWDEALKSRR